MSPTTHSYNVNIIINSLPYTYNLHMETNFVIMPHSLYIQWQIYLLFDIIGSQNKEFTLGHSWKSTALFSSCNNGWTWLKLTGASLTEVCIERQEIPKHVQHKINTVSTSLICPLWASFHQLSVQTVNQLYVLTD